MKMKSMSIRSYLIAFVLISILPVLIFSAVMTALFWRQQRAAFEQQFLERVRAMSIALDSELQGYISALRVLAHSAYLRSGDLAGFYAQAARVRVEQPAWATVVLADLDGRQLINLRMPYGAPLPDGALSSGVLTAAAKARQAVVSGLFKNPVTGTYSASWRSLRRQVIDRQIRHLSRLVDDLLDVSRVTSGKVLLAREPLELSKLVAGAMST